MAQGDLAALSDVKAWLGLTSSTDDVMLGRLISSASRLIANHCDRKGFYVRQATDVTSGNGKPELTLREYPVLSITSLTVNNVAIQQQISPPYGAGWVLDPWSGNDDQGPQRLVVWGSDIYPPGPLWTLGMLNISCVYQAGYRTSEAVTVPATPFEYVAQRPWSSDQGVAYATGAALTPVTSGTPTLGHYKVTLAGSVATYVFAAADAGAAVVVTYGYVPDDLQQATIELVGERYRAKDRIGMISKTLGGQETTSFSQRDMNATIAGILQPFCNVSPFR